MFFGANQFPKEFFDMMEKVFVEKLNEAIRNPAFLSSFSKVVEGGLDSKKKVDDLTRNYLEKMHLPSKDDVAHILQYMQQIESKIISLEEKVEDLTDSLAKANAKPAGKAHEPSKPAPTAKTAQKQKKASRRKGK